MPRYLKLGVAKNTDRDTSLFQTDLREEHDDLQRRQISSWPSLRRAQSTRERMEAPRRSVTYSSSRAEKNEEDEEAPSRRRDCDLVEQQQQLRRAKSSREPAIHAQEEGLGPLEAAVQRALAIRQGKGSNLDHSNPVVSSFVKQLKQHQQQIQKIHLPRAQSLRYNRIVSADSGEEDLSARVADYPDRGGLAPPRHSCVEKFCLEKGDRKRLVKISASYQTLDGERLSIECAQCGRWLGTVAQRHNLDEGSIKLCQICHPVQESVANHCGTAPDSLSIKAEDQQRQKKGISFMRGLRKMLGLKNSKNTAR